MVNDLAAPDSAVGTNRARDLRVVSPGVHRTRLIRHRLETRAILALADLPNERPFRDQREHQEVIARVASVGCSGQGALVEEAERMSLMIQWDATATDIIGQ